MEIDFDKFRELQYCDNDLCKYYNQIGLGNESQEQTSLL